MKAKHYIEIGLQRDHLYDQFRAKEHGLPMDGMARDVIAEVIHIAHGVAAHNNFMFAVDYPYMLEPQAGQAPHVGGMVRIFAQDPQHLNLIAQAVKRSLNIRHLVGVSKTHQSPKAGRGHSFNQVRHNNSKYAICRDNDVSSSPRVPMSVERMEKKLAHLALLPYLSIYAQSAQRNFKLYIRKAPGAWDPEVEIHPNGYGLSVATRPFVLPAI